VNDAAMLPRSVQVVQSARELSPVAEAEAVPALAPELAPAKPATAAEPLSIRSPRARGGAPNAEELTRAFRRQQGPIAGCFEQHAVGLSGVPVVTLEFSLDDEGKVLSAHVQPAALASTPLGQCIQRVAQKTRFPAQGRGVSFAIPLSASKGPTQP
jgi:hypothetical protein